MVLHLSKKHKRARLSLRGSDIVTSVAETELPDMLVHPEYGRHQLEVTHTRKPSHRTLNLTRFPPHRSLRLARISPASMAFWRWRQVLLFVSSASGKRPLPALLTFARKTSTGVARSWRR
jgi:hypothetical protein